MTIGLDIPFLTDLDSRAAVKGSRDPLGIQPIWTRFGRHVVGNLTTVSSSVRDFTATLLGYWFAEHVADEYGPGTELSTFLKWEQLAAYARAGVNRDYAFRGTERVRRALAEGSRVTLSDLPAHQILSNQKIYGLWGLYTVPARASGLLDGDPPRLTPPAREFVERECLPVFEFAAGRDARLLRKLLSGATARIQLDATDARLIGVVAKVLRTRLSDRERKFYTEHLLHGGPRDTTNGRQRGLAALLSEALEVGGFTLSPTAMRQLSREAARRGAACAQLGDRLTAIRVCEAVLAPASVAFTWLLGLDGQFTEVASRGLAQAWNRGLRAVDAAAFSELKAEAGAGDGPAGERWAGIAHALSAGDYGRLVELLLAQNAAVMAQRGGMPWIEERAGRLHVRFRDEQGKLTERDALSGLWRFPYFLDSLASIAAQLRMN